MNILMITPSFWPHIGGVEKHVLKLSQELIKKKYNLFIITKKHSGREKNIENYKGITILRHSSRGLKVWYYFWKQKNIIKKAEIIHCHDFTSFLWYLPFRFIMPYKKVFITFHGWEGDYPPKLKTKIYRKIAEKLSWGNICIGKFIEKWYNQKANIILYGAIDKLKIRPKTPIALNQGIFVGRLANDAGIKLYLKAIVILKHKNIDFSLDIYGNGDLKEELTNFIMTNKLKVNFREVTTNPWQNAPEAYWAFVSGYLSILEAMNSKKYIISVYDNKLKKDYLTLSPFINKLAIFNKASDIAEFIQKEIQNQALCSIINENYLFVQKFTWQNIVQTYLKLWKNQLTNDNNCLMKFFTPSKFDDL